MGRTEVQWAWREASIKYTNRKEKRETYNKVTLQWPMGGKKVLRGPTAWLHVIETPAREESE